MNDKVTYAKAVAIILMVIGHSSCGIPFLVQTLYMFHMPLFFFFSGFCFKQKYLGAPLEYFLRRIKGVNLPYVKWSMLFLLAHNIFFDINLYNLTCEFRGTYVVPYSYAELLSHAKMIILYMEGHDQLLGGYWFLKALFYCSIISFFLLELAKRISRISNLYIAKIVLILVVLVGVLAINHYSYVIPVLNIGCTPFLASLYFLVGNFFAEFRIPTFKNNYILLTSFGLVFIGSFFWRMDMGGMFCENKKLVPSVALAIIGSWSVYSLPWYKMCTRIASLLRFVGSNTLSILTWHFLSFKIVTYIIIVIYNQPIESLAEFPVLSDYANKQNWWIVYVLVGLLFPCIIAYSSKKIHTLIIN